MASPTADFPVWVIPTLPPCIARPGGLNGTIIVLKQGLSDPWREGEEFCLFDPCGLSLFCFGHSDCCRMFSKPHSPSPPNYASQEGLVQSSIPENVLTWSVVSVWNLVLVYVRDEEEIFPVLGILCVFLSLRFSPYNVVVRSRCSVKLKVLEIFITAW